MLSNQYNSALIGVLFIGAMVVGIFSVTPSIDAQNYLTEAAKNHTQIAMAAMLQFAMAIIYFTIAALIYPLIRKYGENLALSYLSLKIMAAILVIISTVLLMPIFELSQEFTRVPAPDIFAFDAIGKVLKTTRDQINHVFMILVLCLGNLILYVLLIKSGLVPKWISYLGLIGIGLSSIASILVLFRVFEIITPEYLLMNAPTALTELILGLWLIVKGFNTTA